MEQILARYAHTGIPHHKFNLIRMDRLDAHKNSAIFLREQNGILDNVHDNLLQRDGVSEHRLPFTEPQLDLKIL